MYHREAIARSVRAVCCTTMESDFSGSPSRFFQDWREAGCPVQPQPTLSWDKHRVYLRQIRIEDPDRSKRFELDRGGVARLSAEKALEVHAHIELPSNIAIVQAVDAALHEWLLPNLESDPQVVEDWFQRGGPVKVGLCLGGGRTCDVTYK